MEPTIKNFRLRGRSGEFEGKWLWTIGLATNSGIPYRDTLPLEDVERHPGKYVVSPNFIEEEGSAMQLFSLEVAMRYQRILKVAGFDTQLV